MKKILATLTMLVVSLLLFAQLKPRAAVNIKLIDKIDVAMTSDRPNDDAAKLISGMNLLPIGSDDSSMQRFSNYKDFDKSYDKHPGAMCAVVATGDKGKRSDSFTLIFFNDDEFTNLLDQLDESAKYRYQGSKTDTESIEHEYSLVGKGSDRSSLYLKAYRSGLRVVMYVHW